MARFVDLRYRFACVNKVAVRHMYPSRYYKYSIWDCPYYDIAYTIKFFITFRIFIDIPATICYNKFHKVGERNDRKTKTPFR
ncbi:hypothetical protein FACS189492_3070 [Clostridia bacterium]|nr:hypothetical protein FACS189492_3070 [Clostridia bacterium]